MTFLLTYLLKCSLSLALVWLLYRLVLRPLTFYQWNRFYLLGYGCLCLVIPFINIGEFSTTGGSPARPWISRIPVLEDYAPLKSAIPGPSLPAAVGFSFQQACLWVFTAGLAVMLLRLGFQIASLQRIRSRSRLLERTPELTLFETDAALGPFSFGRAVYINPQLHSTADLERIIQHEFVHVRQLHTLDLMLGECLVLLNWFNPFAWALRSAIRQNLEFIADRQVLAQGLDRREYQYLLLKVIGVPSYAMGGQFSYSHLKKRISMMNKLKSARLQLSRFLFILPLLLLLLAAFRAHQNRPVKDQGSVFASGLLLDRLTRQPLAGVKVQAGSKGLQTLTDARGYFALEFPPGTYNDAQTLRAEKKGYITAELLSGQELGKGATSKSQIVISLLEPSKERGTPPAVSMVFERWVYSAEGPGPSYEEVREKYDQYQSMDHDMNRLGMLIKEHPEVALFYSTEDKQGQLVFLKEGSIESYGFPGSPAVAAMENKYGPLPSFFTRNPDYYGQPEPDHSWYYRHWAEIAQQAKAAFHYEGKAAKKILFPGDSRVLVQYPDNRVKVFDMDNKQERADFESVFGSLPDCVPAPATLRTDTLPRARVKTEIRVKNKTVSPEVLTDTLAPVSSGEIRSRVSIITRDSVIRIKTRKGEKNLRSIRIRDSLGTRVILYDSLRAPVALGALKTGNKTRLALRPPIPPQPLQTRTPIILTDTLQDPAPPGALKTGNKTRLLPRPPIPPQPLQKRTPIILADTLRAPVSGTRAKGSSPVRTNARPRLAAPVVSQLKQASGVDSSHYGSAVTIVTDSLVIRIKAGQTISVTGKPVTASFRTSLPN